MEANTQQPVPDFLALAKTLKNDMVRYAAVTGLNFFIDSFNKQGFTDTSFEPWSKRNPDTRPGGSLFVERNNKKVQACYCCITYHIIF